jgi:spermidine synthase
VLSLIGFTTIIAQIVLVRELVVVFHGNEMSLGLILATWLLWTAVGSGVLGRLVAVSRSPGVTVALLQTALALLLPFTVLSVREIGRAFGATIGEVLGPGMMLLASQLALGAVCVASGGLFAAGSRLYASVHGRTTAGASSAVYVLEALGSTVGGALASIFVIRYLNSIEIALILSVLNLLSAVVLTVANTLRRTVIIAVIAVVYAVVIIPFGGRAIETASLQHMWSGFQLLESKNSIYGNLAVLGTDGTRSVYANGVVLVTVPDQPSAEESVHYALLQHPSPRRFLLVGGGIGGALNEALKHPTLERAVYVELDPAVIELGQMYFSDSWSLVAKDPRVATYHSDGRLFLNRTDERFDVIVINLPDPKTAQLNRFYTKEFFEIAARRLAPGGLLSISTTGAENYISEELGQFLRCINKTLREVFDEVVVVPGATVHFFAAGKDGALTAAPDVLVARLHARRIDTQYVSDYYIPFRMSPDRMSDLRARVEPVPVTPVNRDLNPVAYYFNVVLWSTRFHESFRTAIQAPGKVGFAAVVLALCVLAALYAALSMWTVRGRRRLRPGAAACVAAMGFTMIGIEVMILLAFQSLYGYVYHQLAALIAAFMVGLMLGSAVSLRRQARRDPGPPTRREVGTLVKLQIAAVVLAPALYALIALLPGVTHPAGAFAVGNVLFPLMAVVSGALGGYQFPLASRVYFGFSDTDRGRSHPGAVYACDLAGACVGAAAIGAYLIPVYGFLQTALIVSLVNVAPVLVLTFSLSAARTRKQ